ncbi:hypothetical protein EON65_30415 [archaeon]|nr:MAG: hypothetical protein EON65_30415 [archaeon]
MGAKAKGFFDTLWHLSPLHFKPTCISYVSLVYIIAKINSQLALYHLRITRLTVALSKSCSFSPCIYVLGSNFSV